MTTARNPRPAGLPGQPGGQVPGSSGSRRKAAATPPPEPPHRLLWSAAALVLAGGITAAMLVTAGSSTLQQNTARSAPGFPLQSTSGQTVSLASYRRRDVVLYFREGAGCDACFYQMHELEQYAADLRKAGITVLPIVMNSASQIRPELASFGLRTLT